LTLAGGSISVDGVTRADYLINARVPYSLTFNAGAGPLTLSLSGSSDPTYIASAQNLYINCVLASSAGATPAIGLIRNGSGGGAWGSGDCPIILRGAHTF